MIGEYGRALFGQVFGDEAFHDYRSLREQSFDGCRIEINGSAALHGLHWEALADPDLLDPLAVRMPVTRRVSGQPSRFAVRNGLPTLNIVVVTARPDGPGDVGYRTISRPLLDALRTAGLPVTVDLVRPGTWQALVDHLQAATARHDSGWYHIAHFDLHGAFAEYGLLAAERDAGRLLFTPRSLAEFEGQRGLLFFETAQEGKAQPVPAEAVAALLAEHRLPVAVLNACQSAMQSGDEAGLAQRLAEAGVPTAVGMAYSVTVTAAERAMPVLYRHAGDGSDLAAAITAARRDLHQDPSRQAFFGQELELEDWMLPVMFGQRQLRLGLREMTDAEQREFYERQAVVAAEPETEYGFVGRDLDIQAIEHRLLAAAGGGQLLVQGMAGAGKSTLLAHLAWWWQRTGLVDQVFAFSYEDRVWTAGQIVREIRSRLMSSADHARADTTLSEDAQAEQVAGRLRAARHLLVLDNAESITAASAAIPHSLDPAEREKLRKFLARLRGGRTLVLLGSRESEKWLTAGRGPGIYPLPGLDAQAASLLVDKILERHGGGRWLTDDAERTALQDLVALLGGYPLPLTVVLPVLASTPPSAVLAELRSGDPAPDPARLITRAIEYSHGKLDPALQNSLMLLAPFTAVIPSGSALDSYRELLAEHDLIRALGPISLAAALDQAVSVGLAAPHHRLGHLVQLQPVLPWFLRSRLHGEPVGVAFAVHQAHYQLYRDSIAPTLYAMMTSGDDPQNRIVGQAAAQAEYVNLSAALDHGRRAGEPISPLITALDEYLNQAQQNQARRHLVDDAIAGYPDPVGDEQRRELALLHRLAGSTAFAQRRLEDAEAHFRAELLLKQALDDRRGTADVYHELGMVAEEQRRFGEAEAAFRHALDILLEFGDRYSAARTNAQLGIVAQKQRRFGEAEAAFRHALDILLEFGDRHSAARAYHQLGMVAHEQRRFTDAEAAYQHALDIDLEFGNRYSAAITYHQLGNLAQEQRRFTDAEAAYRNALDIDLEFGDRHAAAITYHQLGTVAHVQGRFAEAKAAYQHALDIHLELGDQHAAASSYHNLGAVAQVQGRFAEAEAAYKHALDIKLEFGDRHAAAITYHQLGNLACERGRSAEAEAAYRRALDVFLESDPRKASATATRLAIALADLGRHSEAAAVLLTAAITWRRETGNWDQGDLDLLKQERARLEAAEFIAIVNAGVPDELMEEFTAAIGTQ